MKLIIVSLAILLAFAHAHEGVSRLSALRKALFDGYDKEVNPSHKISAQVNLHVNDLKLCPHKQILSVYGWTMMSWNDSRLAWNPEDFGGLSRIRVNSKFLWIPDITLYNAVEPPKTNFVTWEDNTNAIVYSNGAVIFVPPTIMKSHCNVNYDDWPWGTQNCTLKLGSWTFDKSNVDIESYTTWGSCPDVSMTWNDGLEIVDSSCERSEKTYDCCPDEVYPALNMNLQFKYTQKFVDDELKKP